MEWLNQIWVLRTIVLPALDVLILAFLIYKGYQVLVQTRAVPLIKGAVLVLLTYGVAFFLNLDTLRTLLDLLAPSLVIALAVSPSRAGDGQADTASLLLFDFEDASASRWSIVNDGVMGGRSQGYGRIAEGIMRFDGTLVTRGGGFTSVRTVHRADLSDFDGLEMRVRGNGRRFEVEINDGRRYRWRPVSRRIPFDTSGQWRTVRVSFSDLRSTVFGRSVSVPEIDLASIQQIGFYILDGIDGPFWLEVDRVRAYRYDDGSGG